MTYQVSIPNLSSLQAAFSDAPLTTAREVTKAVNQSTVSLQGTAKVLAPIDSGRLRQGIQRANAKATGNVITGSVKATAKYSLAVEEGTGIYGPAKRPIRPKSKPYLMFKTKSGQWVRTKEVKGQLGQFYMKRSIAVEQDRITGFFEGAKERITRQLAA